MEFIDLMNLIGDYEPQYKRLIIKAYEFADEHHKGCKRKSGDRYITHPVAVACILASWKADADTIAAALLHDTIEDCEDVSVDTIREEFNDVIAVLVDGVTEIKKIDFNNDKRLADIATQVKISESITKDIRILIIKFADRIHNMRTLEHMPREKQIKKAQDTMDFFVPLANLLGLYQIKSELEDLCFKYLNPEEYELLEKKRTEMIKDNTVMLNNIIKDVSKELAIRGVKFDVNLKYNNVYSLYEKLHYYNDLRDLHNLFSVEWILDNVSDCYIVEEIIKEKYSCIPEKAKNYISRPKPNMYMANHQSTYINENLKVQHQFKTKEMHEVNEAGIISFWRTISLNHPEVKMQEGLQLFDFYNLLVQLISTNSDMIDFNVRVLDEVLRKSIKISLVDGEEISIPQGSKPLDLAYYKYGNVENVETVIINGKERPLDIVLKDGDVVGIVYNDQIKREEYSGCCNTAAAREYVLSLKK